MIEIKFDSGKVLDALGRLQRSVADASPVMAQIAGVMHDAVEENFAQQGRPKWLGLSRATLEGHILGKARGSKRGIRKDGRISKTVANHAAGRMILQNSGQLAGSISESHDSNSASVGTNKIYAAIHQFGGKAGRGRKVTIPARPYLSMTPEDEDRIVGKVDAYLKSVIG